MASSTPLRERTFWASGDFRRGVTEEGLAFTGIGDDPCGDLFTLGRGVVYMCGRADPGLLAADARAAGYDVTGNQHADRWNIRVRRGGAPGSLLILPIARWLDAQDVSHHQARRVMLALGDRIRADFGRLLAPTPAETGFSCWQVSGQSYSSLPLEIRKAFVGTQGRFQVAPVVETIPALYCLDMRLAYAAAAMQVQSAAEWRHEEWPVGGWADDGWATGDPSSGFLGYTPARYRVRFRAPEGWGHVGLLPARSEALGVVYPSNSSASWETWADASEVRLAIEQGWHIEVLERIYAVKGEGRSSWLQPMRTWTGKLIAAREELGGPEVSGDDAPLYRAAIRNVILHTIGLMAGRTLLDTRAVDREPEEWASWSDVPEGAIRGSEREEGRDILYQKERRARLGMFDHPELAHQVWGLTRSWLLKRTHRKAGEEPVTVGALTRPREEVIAFAQDAILLTGEPSWPDDGRPGRYRVKQFRQGPFPAPRNRREVLEILGDDDAA